MAFVSGVFLIDAPASALNNGQGEPTKAKVKVIYADGLAYPYVSAQSFRFWLRDTLDNDSQWKTAPVTVAGAGNKQQAFTEGNPIDYWDDDLFGYMRAEKSETVTRLSPFRTSTLVSIAPVQITDDFGVMGRFDKQEGDKEGVILHGHEFYRAVLKGLFSLNLHMAGTFSFRHRTGFMNLGATKREMAVTRGLEELPQEQAYRLPINERILRIQTLLRALGRVEGGAKQALHYTDVAPAFVIAAITKGGSNPFGRIIATDNFSRPIIHLNALKQALEVFGNDLLSGVYVGRAQGFMDSSVEELAQVFGDEPLLHPRQALDALADDLGQHPEWLG